MYKKLIDFIRNHYGTEDFIPLHAPVFQGNERKYVLDTIDSTFVSSVGAYVNQFEHELEKFTNAESAVATVNGTTALTAALRLVGTSNDDEVITQPLTFVATANAIAHLCATPVFVDVDTKTMGMSPSALEEWLEKNAEIKEFSTDKQSSFNIHTGKRISAIVPMHTFGHPCDIHRIVDLARKWSIPVVEDAAEAIGSYSGGTHCGIIGDVGVLSFNGNKTITCGGGGAILTNDAELGVKAKHLTTTAKVPHKWEFEHDEIAYNFRMPNLNAALACAQLERLPAILKEKRELAANYKNFFESADWADFLPEPEGTISNYWLCAIALKDKAKRNTFLEKVNASGVMARPIWKLMPDLPMYSSCQCGELKNSRWLQDRVLNLPSGIAS